MGKCCDIYDKCIEEHCPVECKSVLDWTDIWGSQNMRKGLFFNEKICERTLIEITLIVIDHNRFFS